MSLDVDEPQVLVRFPDDPVTWHHRVLLRRLRDATWIVLTPDFSVEVADLSAHNLFPLIRATPLPAPMVADAYLFAPGSEPQIAGFHSQAGRIANILGGGAVPRAEGGAPHLSWRVADTSVPDFGAEVSDDVVESAATGVTRGAIGLARVGEPARWVFVERVPIAELLAWEQDKQSGAGRDRRLGAPQGPLGVVGLQEAIAGFRPRDLKEVVDWPHQGPRAVSEFLRSVLTLGLTMFTYHDHWVRQSGVHGESSVSWEHKMLCAALAMAIGYDRLDVTNVASFELVARRILMIERAVRVNPKAPSFVGLHKMIEHALDEGGGVATREFTAHMATLAEAEARILKQNRLLREELEARKKTDCTTDKDKGGGGKNKNKDKDGGGSATETK